ncbi:MAG: NAD-dependent epimerase/dehydratase family protein [Proteobacteria bacterium]|nr:NAD-dependent epimerase/dehydratase family protein [Pseudomonadota bacterium]
MKVLITGGSGFVGENLRLHLARRKDVEVVCFARGDDLTDLPRLIQGANFVFHLAGVNRPKDPLEYTAGNVDLTLALCEAAAGVASETGWKAQIVYASSIQAVQGTVYGESKRAAENLLRAMALEYGLTVHLFRLPNVFGKWCKPMPSRSRTSCAILRIAAAIEAGLSGSK